MAAQLVDLVAVKWVLLWAITMVQMKAGMTAVVTVVAMANSLVEGWAVLWAELKVALMGNAKVVRKVVVLVASLVVATGGE